MEKNKKFKLIILSLIILSIAIEFVPYISTMKKYMLYSKEQEERKVYENRDRETYYHNGSIKFRKIGSRIEKYNEKGVMIYAEENGKEENYDDAGNRIDLNYSESSEIKDGEYKLYSPKGNLILDYNYKNGEFDGVQKEYYADSEILFSEKNYKNGSLIGEQKTYYKDGNIETYKNYNENGKLIADIVYDMFGKKEKFFEEKNNVGVYEEYQDNYLIEKKELHYSKGNIVKSVQEEYGEKGILKYKEIEDKALILTEKISYYEDGQIKDISYRRERKVLPIGKMYYSNGNLENNSYYDENSGKLICERYFEDGKLLSKSLYSGKDLYDEIEYYIENKKDGTKFYEVKKEGDKKVEIFYNKKGEVLHKEIKGED